jgi:hypothetical protein
MHIHSSNPVISRDFAFKFCTRFRRIGIAHSPEGAKINSALLICEALKAKKVFPQFDRRFVLACANATRYIQFAGPPIDRA